MANDLTPTDVCERLIGLPPKIAAVVGISEKSPYNWRRLSGRFRAKGDLPYPAHMRALLIHSAAHQLGLTAEHLIWGAPEAEIAAILAARGVPGQLPLEPDFTSHRVAAE